jgi:hypothetical protein
MFSSPSFQHRIIHDKRNVNKRVSTNSVNTATDTHTRQPKHLNKTSTCTPGQRTRTDVGPCTPCGTCNQHLCTPSHTGEDQQLSADTPIRIDHPPLDAQVVSAHAAVYDKANMCQPCMLAEGYSSFLYLHPSYTSTDELCTKQIPSTTRPWYHLHHRLPR